MSRDPIAGTLSSVATSEASTLIGFGWGSAALEQPLHLDVSGFSRIEIPYSSNLDTDASISLANNLNSPDQRSSDFDFIIPAGTGTLKIPLSSITGVVMGTPRFVDGQIIRDPLPPVDFTALDAVSFVIGSTEATILPLGLEISLNSIAFVPEPVTAVLVLSGMVMLCMTRLRV